MKGVITELTAILTNIFNNILISDSIPKRGNLEFVSKYTYLGQLISPKNLIAKEINTRIANGWKKFWSLEEIMKSQDLGMSLKRKTFNICVLPCVIYACETWALNKSFRDKLSKRQRTTERTRVGSKDRVRVKNVDMRMKTKLTDILLRIDQQNCPVRSWTGHMKRDKQGK
ncbi:Putative uncharacterized transposon-derived protein F52C9.6 [Eumeta japonica]|uniref:Uncharacterized transposon-derived protein F52C9.6 n=1 Tax=Eumeta variegata TaxID=151549 RepID=A0A4C1V2Q3_EUMVA|nr:Putative uncharacterized transposon-derived protein F52C9.6 [Eumeta japonica]